MRVKDVVKNELRIDPPRIRFYCDGLPLASSFSSRRPFPLQGINSLHTRSLSTTTSTTTGKCDKSMLSSIVQQQKITKPLFSSTKCFGTKRIATEEQEHDNNREQQKPGAKSSSFQYQGVPGAITIYNEQLTLPNIDISKIEQTISIIREIINYPTYDVNLVLVDDEDMKQTNYETRQINKPTDILSFPFHDTEKGGARGAGLLQEPEFDIPDYYTLGDMMIDIPYVMRRCEEDKLFYERLCEIEQTGIADDIDEIDGDGKADAKYEIIEEEYEDYVGDDDRGVSGAMANIYDPEERIHMLLVHGMLHLVGYDHIEDEDYEVMVTKEEEVLELLKKRLEHLSATDSED